MNHEICNVYIDILVITVIGIVLIVLVIQVVIVVLLVCDHYTGCISYDDWH